MTPYGQSNVPDWFDKLQAVIQNQEPEDEPSVEQETIREEWMILSDLHTPFDNSEQTPDSTNDWHLDRANYSEQQIQEMPAWIKTKRSTRLMSNMMLLTSTVLVKCENLFMLLLSLILIIHHLKERRYV